MIKPNLVSVEVTMHGVTHYYRFFSFSDALTFVDALHLSPTPFEGSLLFDFTNLENGKSEKSGSE